MSSNGVYGEAGQQLLQRDLELAVSIIPVELREKVWEHEEHMDLVELVLDYGRKPLARFPSGDFILSERLVTDEDLADAVASVGHFDDSNRAGVEGTLHRISCIRDREDNIYGLTIRIGRALITETTALVERPLKEGKSILIIGPPGVGKTSAIRNFCRVLSEDCKKRVMIVDTSNEIGGPGRVPHHAVGSCRRMQVKQRSEQHNVLIEAVQNHMPEVIVVDEIGKTEECHAIRAIAQRGVQLFATTHGHSLERMIKDRVLRELVGGVNNVTIGDVKAKELGKDKKTVLERVDDSCFDVIVEMAGQTRWRIHYNANKAVDAILKDSSPNAETRYLDKDGNMVVEQEVEDEECQGHPSVVNNVPKKSIFGSTQVWDIDTQVQDDWGNDSSFPPVADTRDSTIDNWQTEQKEEEEEANPVKSLAVKEARRILLERSKLEILQAESSASKEQIKQCFELVSGRIAKTNNEHQIVTMARDRLNRAYQEMLIELQCKEAQAQVSKKAISKEAKRVMNATSELEVLQVTHNASRKEIRKRFTETNKKLPKTDNEEETVTIARTLVQKSYEELIDWLMCENVNTLKQARLKEAERIINTDYDLEILQVDSNYSLEELKESFNYVNMTIQKYPDEEDALRQARMCLQAAYKRLRDFLF